MSEHHVLLEWNDLVRIDLQWRGGACFVRKESSNREEEQEEEGHVASKIKRREDTVEDRPAAAMP